MRTLQRRGISLVCGLWVAVLVIALTPARASAQNQIFMLVPGIQGGSVNAQHVNWIDVISLRQSFSDRKKPCDIQVVKGLDVASPKLWLAAVMGTNFTEVRIDAVKSGDTPLKFYEVRLQNAQITSITTSGQEAFLETVSLTATTMVLTFYPQNADGTIGTPVTTSVPCN